MENNVPDETSRQILQSSRGLINDFNEIINKNDLDGAIKKLKECFDALKGLLQNLENQAYRDFILKVMVENVATQQKLSSGYGNVHDDIREILNYCTYLTSQLLNNEAASSDFDWVKLAREVGARAESKQIRIDFELGIGQALKLQTLIENGDLTGVPGMLKEKSELETSMLPDITDENLFIAMLEILVRNIATQRKLESSGKVDDARAYFPAAEAAFTKFLAKDSTSELIEISREVEPELRPLVLSTNA